MVLKPGGALATPIYDPLMLYHVPGVWVVWLMGTFLTFIIILLIYLGVYSLEQGRVT